MQCTTFEDQVVELALGLLPDAAALLTHAALCPDCAALLAEERALEAQLAHAFEAPPGLNAAIKDALRTQQTAPTPARAPSRRRWYLAAAALLAVALWAGLRTRPTVHATAITGRSQLITDGQAQVLSSQAFADGQTLRTGAQASATLRTPRAHLWLGPNTELSLNAGALTLRRGTARITTHPGTPWVIHTPRGAVRSRAGTFELHLSEAPMNAKALIAIGAIGAAAVLAITVQSGDVDVTDAQGTRTVHTGQSAVLPPSARAEATPDPRIAALESEVRSLRSAKAAAQSEVKRLQARLDVLAKEAASDDITLRPTAEVRSDLKALMKAEGLKIFGLAKDHPLFKELVAMGPEGVKLLGAMLKTGDQSERFGAAALMEKLMNADAVPHLEAAIFGGDNDDNVLVQRMASHALGKIGGETAIPVLERVVAEGSEWGVRTNAAYSLAEMGRSSGIDWLLENYEAQSDAGAKMAILGAMGQIGDPSYLPTLHTVLKEETEYSKRYLAVTGIAKAARAESLPVLEAIISNPDEDKMIITEAQKAYDEIKTQE